MKPFVYADTCFFLALFMEKDNLHLPALQAAKSVQDLQIVTSDFVLIEFLNSMSRISLKAKGIQCYQEICNSCIVLPARREDFLKAFNAYYLNRRDKEYSMTDCISMFIAKENDIEKILTADKHFSQEGFRILMHKNQG